MASGADIIALQTMGQWRSASAGDFPDVGNVLTDDTTDGVAGTFQNVDPQYVDNGIQWGEDGVEFTGTRVIPGPSNATAGSYLGPGGAMRQLFIDDTNGVYSIVGYKMYPVIAPQNAAPPYGVYRVVDVTRDELMTNTDGMPRARIQWDWIVSARNEVNAVEVLDILCNHARLAAQRIHNYIVTIGSVSIHIHEIMLEDERDGFEPIIDASGKPMFTQQQDFYVWYNETQPSR